ncbi:hypothetical protein AX17_003925 [Amanita inopinata Kibby_2008]|nr:hypothetical protein AX17_003925 [Amanita inopinata Kibby_2008]
MPHPYPHDHLVLVASKEGLLMRPQVPESGTGAPLSPPPSQDPVSFIRIQWGKGVVTEEVDLGEDGQTGRGVDWKTGVVVYGISPHFVLLVLSKITNGTGSYLLVINSRVNVGHVLDPFHAVYCIKQVTAIPLVEDRARMVLNALAARNAASTRPSLLPNLFSVDLRANPEASPSLKSEQAHSGPHVRFSSGAVIPEVLVQDSQGVVYQGGEYYGGQRGHMRASSSPQSSTSDLSASFAEDPSSRVIQAIAPRLSFWSKLTKPAQSLTQILSPPTKEKDATSSEAIAPLSDEGSENVGQDPGFLERLIHEKKEEPSEVLGNILAAFALQPSSVEERHSELETKIVRECIREFTKGDMYFAHTFDITRSLQHKQERITKSQKEHALLADLNALPASEAPPKPGTNRLDSQVNPSSEPYPTLPLWRRVDRQFWWNEWLIKPLVDAGLHSYVLPIMQGYYQAATFHIPPDSPPDENTTPVEYVIISRRSKDRAGLRYQRRGIDDEAHVANFVETETIMRVVREGRENVFSYVQIRGSIPLYWTQNGYGLKPPPTLATDRTHEQNLDALKRHFQRTIPRYGPHTIVNLAEQHGREGPITREYKQYVNELNSKDVTYHEYDFHAETRGMKYENIYHLIQAMERTFDSQGYLWVSDGLVFSKQKAIFRVNCIDCLDRTNVVQSAFARYMLNKQLSALALLLPTTEKKSDIDTVFNNVWANNGDAISRAYAGTSALKGDFTRTGKRDLGGMLNDGMNSLARMYSSTFSDWFCQAVIDFMLGNRTITVFSEFLFKLRSTDPSDLVRLSKIRAEAIATSVSRVLPEGERLLSGWTLFAPEELNTRVGMKFEEKVLLLSVKALYIISYDYTLDEVKLYTRVPLGDIITISKGAYILSPLEEASRNPEENAGFVVTWLTSSQESRICNYSVQNSVEAPAAASSSLLNFPQMPRKENVPMPRNETFAAFKVLPVDPARIRRASSTGDGGYAEASDELNNASTCREAVDLIVDSVERACRDVGWRGRIVEGDVVGLEEAQKMTSVYAKMEYGVKRLLWLGGGLTRLLLSLSLPPSIVMAQLLPPPQPGSAGRISQLLPSVKCSSCNQLVPLSDLGEHVCSAAQPPPPSSLPHRPFLPDNNNNNSPRLTTSALPPARTNSPRIPSPLSRAGPERLNTTPSPSPLGRTRNASLTSGRPPQQTLPPGDAVRVRALSNASRKPPSPAIPSSARPMNLIPGNNRGNSVSLPLPPVPPSPVQPPARSTSHTSPNNPPPSGAHVPFPVQRDGRPARPPDPSLGHPSLMERQRRPSNFSISSNRSNTTSPRPPPAMHVVQPSIASTMTRSVYSPSPPDHMPPQNVAPQRPYYPETNIDTSSGGAAGMAGVGRRGFAAAARAAMFTVGHSNANRRMDPPRFLDIVAATRAATETPPLSSDSPGVPSPFPQSPLTPDAKMTRSPSPGQFPSAISTSPAAKGFSSELPVTPTTPTMQPPLSRLQFFDKFKNNMPGVNNAPDADIIYETGGLNSNNGIPPTPSTAVPPDRARTSATGRDYSPPPPSEADSVSMYAPSPPTRTLSLNSVREGNRPRSPSSDSDCGLAYADSDDGNDSEHAPSLKNDSESKPNPLQFGGSILRTGSIASTAHVRFPSNDTISTLHTTTTTTQNRNRGHNNIPIPGSKHRRGGSSSSISSNEGQDRINSSVIAHALGLSGTPPKDYGKLGGPGVTGFGERIGRSTSRSSSASRGTYSRAPVNGTEATELDKRTNGGSQDKDAVLTKRDVYDDDRGIGLPSTKAHRSNTVQVAYSPEMRAPKMPTRSRTSPIVERGKDSGAANRDKEVDRPQGRDGEKRERTRKIRVCTKCSKRIEDGRWVQCDGGGVLCDSCWKSMYLPRCRRCDKPIEKQAVSSSDGQLKGKYHRECFNCHICHEPFPDKTFYVFDGKPLCAYHYHQANDSLCASVRCGQPIEGPCAVSHAGDRFHPEHFTCDYIGYPPCNEKLVEYWEVDGRMLCEKHVASAGRGVGEDGSDDDGDFYYYQQKTRSSKATKRVTRFIDLANRGGNGGVEGSDLR